MKAIWIFELLGLNYWYIQSYWALICLCTSKKVLYCQELCLMYSYLQGYWFSIWVRCLPFFLWKQFLDIINFCFQVKRRLLKINYNFQMRIKLKKVAHKAIAKKVGKQGLKGEADRFIGSKMPKHLFSGKRGIGKTSRR